MGSLLQLRGSQHSVVSVSAVKTLTMSQVSKGEVQLDEILEGCDVVRFLHGVENDKIYIACHDDHGLETLKAQSQSRNGNRATDAQVIDMWTELDPDLSRIAVTDASPVAEISVVRVLSGDEFDGATVEMLHGLVIFCNHETDKIYMVKENAFDPLAILPH